MRRRLAALRRAPCPAGADGFTLVELLVAMILTGLVGALVLRGFLTTSDGLSRADYRNRTTRDLAVVLDHMTKVLQSAQRPYRDRSRWSGDGYPSGNPPVIIPGNSSGVEATFTADLGDPRGPSLVHWFVDSQKQLMEETVAADPGTASYHYSSQQPRRRALASNVVLPQGTERAIFSWFGPQSSALLNPGDPTARLSASGRAAAMAVEITLSVGEPARRNVATAVNFVVMPAALATLPEPPNWPTQPENPAPPPVGGCGTCITATSPGPSSSPTSTTTVTGPAPGPTTQAPTPPPPPPPAPPKGPPAGLS